MITILPCKGLSRHIDVIQRNAIKSWTRLSIKPEIILLGTDEDTAKSLASLVASHRVARNAEARAGQ